MKRVVKKFSLILALVLVINSCNTFCVSTVKGEDTPTLTFEVNLDVKEANVSNEGIFASKALSVVVNTESSSEDMQTVVLYKKAEAEDGKDIEIDKKYITPQQDTILGVPYGDYKGNVTFNINTDDNTVSEGEYFVTVTNATNTSEEPKEVLTSYDGHNITKIIIDKVKPHMNGNGEITIATWFEEVGEEKKEIEHKKTTFKAVFSDDPGIAKIEYKVNNEARQVYFEKNINNAPKANVEFEYSKEGMEDYNLYFYITDNAGNMFECSSEDFVITYPDNMPPEINDITFEPYYGDTNTETDNEIDEGLEDITEAIEFNEISKILYNEICVVSAPFTITVDVEDVAPEGVKANGMEEENVELYYGEKKIASSKENNGKYTFNITDEVIAKPMKIKASDKNGYSVIKTISEIDNSLKDYYFMEKQKPEIHITDAGNVKDEEDNKNWYNNNGGTVTINIQDVQSGIKEILIKDGNKVYDKPVINTYSNEYVKEIDTTELSEGIHQFFVEVTDNCGNPKEETHIIYVDHSNPSISYEINTPESVDIDGVDWYDFNATMTVTATIKPSIAPINKVEFEINGVGYAYTETIKEINDSKKVVLEIPIKDYMEEGKNDFEIKGYVESVSGNNNDGADIYNCKIDKKNPEINSIIVNKTNEDILSTSLNLINTGIFSNDSVSFKVEAKEEEGDSGIDRVELIYYQNNEKVVKTLTKTNDRFEYDLPFGLDANTFCSEFEIIAYDRCGKTSDLSPKVYNENGVSAGKNYIMQENIAPIAEVNLEDTDGSERTDGQIWYNKNKNVSINLQDMQSGIRYAKIYVNDVEITSDIAGQKIIDVDTSKALSENKTSLTYNFTTDYIEETVGTSENGNYKIKVEISDNAGNMYINNEKSFNIDKVSPKVDKITFSTKSADNMTSAEGFVADLKYGYYFNKTFNVNVHTSDENPSSGLAKVEYKLISFDSGKKEIIESKASDIVNGVARIDIPKDFKGQLYVKAVDMVGNVSEEVTTLGYIEDENAPEIKISTLKDTKYKDNSGNKLYSKTVNVDVTISDLKSGIRTIEYSVDAEINKVEKTIIKLDNDGYKVGDKLEGGWIVSKVDNNLVVEVTQKFVFDKDDNNIIASFKATDRANNSTNHHNTEKISIDKTLPIIKVSLPNGVDSNPKYYNKNKRAVMTITVEERNFSKDLLNIKIIDSYKNNSIKPKFTKQAGSYTYVATIDFPEGDYSVNISGNDIVGHKAIVYENDQKKAKDHFSTDFIVDTTKPSITTNFSAFVNNSKNGNYFNKAMTAKITVREHNFDPELMNLNVWEKASGQGHNLKDAEKRSYVAYSSSGWNSSEDVHSIELNFESDGIYKIEIAPTDISENEGKSDSTIIFEVDTTAPEVILMNEEAVDGKSVEIIEIYDADRKDDPIPTVEYYDPNIESIEYELVKYIPSYEKGKEFSTVKPETITNTINQKVYKLDEFDKDGLYAVDMVAYDKAGNASKASKCTYVRMIDTDVLAYIENSHPGKDGDKGTGWFSIEDEDGPLSMRPDNFDDLNIAVIAKNDSDISITLNSNDGDIIDTGVECSSKEEVYGAGVYRYVLSKDYFKDHYQEDTDATFYLTVNEANNRIELGQIHIDNIAPECTLPKYFHNWGWMRGSDDKNIEITNISEKIDTNLSNVYIDGKNVKYTYNSDKNTLTFPIEKGSHSVGISLVDNAGNAYNIPEITHLGVGNFRLYLGIGIGVAVIVAVFLIIVLGRKRKARMFE